jgi:hypothetical protein
MNWRVTVSAMVDCTLAASSSFAPVNQDGRSEQVE